MSASRIACLVAGALAWAGSGASAQTDPRLADAVRVAQEGRGDSARTAVQRLLAATPPTDTLYPQILYTQAMVAGSAGEMRRQLQRVTVEYGTSNWADDALLRLIQIDYATRNYEGAARNLERLRLDFPATPLLPQAAYWAAHNYFDSNNPAAACRWLADGMAQSRDDIEVQNRLGYLYQRCELRADSGARAAATDTVRADTARADTARADTAARTIYRVQVAAVATQRAADAAARKARALGLTVVTVEEKGLYKVRVGEYPTREAAQNAAASLKARLGGSPFVVAEP